MLRPCVGSLAIYDVFNFSTNFNQMSSNVVNCFAIWQLMSVNCDQMATVGHKVCFLDVNNELIDFIVSPRRAMEAKIYANELCAERVVNYPTQAASTK